MADHEKTRRDQLAAIEHHRKVRGESLEACNEASALKLLAERKAGKLLADMRKHEGGRPSETCNEMLQVSTLAEIGIDRMQSHRW